MNFEQIFSEAGTARHSSGDGDRTGIGVSGSQEQASPVFEVLDAGWPKAG